MKRYKCRLQLRRHPARRAAGTAAHLAAEDEVERRARVILGFDVERVAFALTLQRLCDRVTGAPCGGER
jgi:hypothetical protein